MGLPRVSRRHPAATLRAPRTGETPRRDGRRPSVPGRTATTTCFTTRLCSQRSGSRAGDLEQGVDRLLAVPFGVQLDLSGDADELDPPHGGGGSLAAGQVAAVAASIALSALEAA